MKVKTISTSTLIMAILLLSTFAAANSLHLQTVSAVEPPDWYSAFWTPGTDGVLDTDYFDLYPYETDESLKIGFSKFGELIDPTRSAPNWGRGLEYRGRDPFCTEDPVNLPPNLWFNGWFIEIKYTSSAQTTKPDRNVWAFALFGDGLTWGGDWAEVTVPTSGAGGRQTNGRCVTDPIQILYDGPRRLIAQMTTHIFDKEGAAVWSLVDVHITLIFNKDKKYIILLKDVKYKLPLKEKGPIDVKFSDREQVDLGPNTVQMPGYKSYAHFWHQDLSTCYGANWLKAKWILREYDETIIWPATVDNDGYWYQYSPGLWEYEVKCPRDPPLPVSPGGPYPAVRGSQKVWLNDVLLEEGKDYVLVDPDGTPPAGRFQWQYKDFLEIRFLKPFKEDDVIDLQYKNIVKVLRDDDQKIDTPFGDEVYYVEDPYEPLASHHYDLAQVISEDAKYVFFKAFWPTTSSYTVDGWFQRFNTLVQVPPNSEWSNGADMTTEPAIPFIIGQWDFMLSPDEKQFRGVEAVGLTDFHDADDANAADLNKDGELTEDQIDREVYYQLQEVFNPWDLNDAVGKIDGDNMEGKNTRRLVEYFTGDDTTTIFDLKKKPWIGGPFVRDPDDENIEGAPFTMPTLTGYEYWYAYCTFAEKVLVDGKLQKPDVDYTLEVVEFDDANEDGDFYDIVFKKAPADGAVIKVLYSTFGGEDPLFGYTTEVPWFANWEWIVVGRDSAAVDSAGAAMVSQYFKNKLMPVWMSGLDMQDTVWSPTVPYVFDQLRPLLAPSRDAYKDAAEAPCHGRSALMNDWCTTVPIETSNIIFVGGYEANVGGAYMNDFRNGLFYVPAGAASKFVAFTCWSKNEYQSELGVTGYAAISTYKDLDGTVIFMVDGINGEDTFWACWWLWNYGEKLQLEPDCVTDVIVKFDYTKHPTDQCFATVVEALGTISEFDFLDYRVVWQLPGGQVPAGDGETTWSFVGPNTLVTAYGCHFDGGFDGPDPLLTEGTRLDLLRLCVAGSEEVVVGTTPIPSTDYTIDYKAGTITVNGEYSGAICYIKFMIKQPPLHLDP